MRSQKIIRLLLFIALVAGCTVEFLPETDESQDLLVVDGMITNQEPGKQDQAVAIHPGRYAPGN